MSLRLVLAAVVACAAVAPTQDRIVVGSKPFPESAILAELMAQIIEEHTELEVVRRINLGGTMICLAALRAGELDIYAEYTGTAWAIVLKEEGKIADPLRTFFHVRRRFLEDHALQWLDPFGLDNTYALAMREATAAKLGIARISDLARHGPRLRGGFSIEFGNREDGYPGLAQAYGLALGSVRALEHGLAYEAIAAGAIDVMDAYSTDGKLLRYELRVLEDDRGFFPPYNAAPVVRAVALERHPEIGAALARLAFRVPDATAQALNFVVEAGGADAARVARAFLEREGLVAGEREACKDARAALDRVLAARPAPGAGAVRRSGFFALLADQRGKLLRNVLEHLGLTLVAVLLAALAAIPLGIAITRRPRLRQITLGMAGIVQTVPSLALLVFMIPLLGLDAKSAVAALFLYALLPILRNTHAGIVGVDPDLVDAARGMGMLPGEVLRRVQLPLAMHVIMAGVRTATVISIGVATLAAFVGAGGLGEPIVEGLYLNDVNLIMIGAVPAALLAIGAELGLGRLEVALQPRTGTRVGRRNLA